MQVGGNMYRVKCGKACQLSVSFLLSGYARSHLNQSRIRIYTGFHNQSA